MRNIHRIIVALLICSAVWSWHAGDSGMLRNHLVIIAFTYTMIRFIVGPILHWAEVRDRRDRVFFWPRFRRLHRGRPLHRG